MYVDVRLIDLSGKGRFLQPSEATDAHSMGFLPDGDLILVSSNYRLEKLEKCQIRRYPFTNKPTDAAFWKYSQMYNIKIRHEIDYFVQTRLFLNNKDLMTQWDLSTMTKMQTQYSLVSDLDVRGITINKNQTLLALHHYDKYSDDKHIDVYSMKTGKYITRYG